MAKFLIEFGIPLLIFFIVISQVIIPAFISNLEFFWFFKRINKPPTTPDQTNLEEKVDNLTQEARQLREAANSEFKKAEKIKKKSDKI